MRVHIIIASILQDVVWPAPRPPAPVWRCSWGPAWCATSLLQIIYSCPKGINTAPCCRKVSLMRQLGPLLECFCHKSLMRTFWKITSQLSLGVFDCCALLCVCVCVFIFFNKTLNCYKCLLSYLVNTNINLKSTLPRLIHYEKQFSNLIIIAWNCLVSRGEKVDFRSTDSPLQQQITRGIRGVFYHQTEGSC